MSSEPTTHHVFCNGHPQSPVEGCRWCDGPKGMWARYPYNDESEVDALVAHHFPSARPRLPEKFFGLPVRACVAVPEGEVWLCSTTRNRR